MKLPQDLHLTVMFIIDVLGEMGGAERNLCQVAQGLKGRGHEVIICAIQGGALSQQLRSEGFIVEEINVKRIYDFEGLKAIVKMIKIVRQKNVSVIMSYHESSDFLGVLLSFLMRIPIVSTRRDMGFKLKNRHIWIYRFVNRFFDRIAAVSEAVRDITVKHQWIRPRHLVVIPNGVGSLSEQNGSALDPGEEVRGGGLVKIFCLANIRAVKGQKYLVEAAALVTKRFPEARFFFIGKTDREPEYLESIRRSIKDLELQEAVAFLGEIPASEVQPQLREMDIAVLPSLSEGMSNALLESMAAGKPVVATAVGGNPEIVDHERTGYLVPPGDPEALANALMRLVGSEDLRRLLGVSGRKRVEAEYGIPRMVDRYEDLLKVVLQRRRIGKCREWYWDFGRFMRNARWRTRVTVSLILYYSGVVAVFRWVKRSFSLGKVKILCFHDVSEKTSHRSEFSLFVKPSSFTQFVRCLAEWYELVGLDEGVALIEGGERLKDDTFVLTFDDGYRGWIKHILPVCARLQMEYTLFISTGPLDSGYPLLYSSLILFAENTWRRVADLSPWNLGVFPLEKTDDITRFVEATESRCRERSGEERTSLIRDLAEYFDVPLNSEVVRSSLLCWEDVRALDTSRATIGGHSVSHTSFGRANEDVYGKEIRESKKRLEEELGHEIRFFAYPYGIPGSRMESMSRFFSELGIRNAFTLDSQNGGRYRPFEIRRRGVSRGMFEEPGGRLSKALLATELSGLGDIVFGRALMRKGKGNRKLY